MSAAASDGKKQMRTAPGRQVVAAMAVAFALASAAPTGAAAVGAGQTCGGFIGLTCGPGLWCDWPARRCGSADIQGKCVEIPAVCPKNIKSVCGCDKRTYGNDCARLRASVQKDHDGACK
jgi:hypothetical protein